MTLNLLGITTVPLPTTAETGFKPSPELAATLITPKTKAIALVTPNNPVRFLFFLPFRSRSYTLVIDWSSISAIIDRLIRNARPQTPDCTHSGRNLPRFSPYRASAYCLFIIRGIVALHPHSPLLLLKVLLYPGPSPRCHRSCARNPDRHPHRA